MASLEEIRGTICAICDSLIAEAGTFRDLDALVGDGDLGVTIAMGCKAIRIRLAHAELATVADLLEATAEELVRENLSSLTGLLKAALNAAADGLAMATTMRHTDWEQPLERAVEAIRDRGGAEVGDKTILDALNGSLLCLTHALRRGCDGHGAANALRIGAEEASTALVNMQARAGRAAWLGERTVGVPDPGAAVWVAITRVIEAAAASH